MNTLCENSLVSGFSRELKQITPEIVVEVASTFRLDPNTMPSAPNPNESEVRKKFLQMARMREQMDGVLDNRPADPPGNQE